MKDKGLLVIPSFTPLSNDDENQRPGRGVGKESFFFFPCRATIRSPFFSTLHCSDTYQTFSRGLKNRGWGGEIHAPL